MKSLNSAIQILIYTAGAIAALLLLPFFLKLFMPFLLALTIAAATQTSVRFLEKKLKISRGISSAMLIALLVAVFCALVSFLIYQLIIQAKGLFSRLPQLTEMSRQQWQFLRHNISQYLSQFSPEVSASVDSALDSVYASVQGLAQPLTDKAVEIAKSFAFSLPNILTFLIMFLLATFFFTKDYAQVMNLLKDIIPHKIRGKLVYLKNTMFMALFKYIKAQLILMCITFAIASVSLWILRIGYPLFIGLIIGAVDALPFFGTGIILFPWAAIMLIEGNYSLAAALVIVHFICQLMRQILEPRIVSAQIGVHPILTLISVYVGLKLFGIIGMLLAPAITILCVNLYVSYKNGQQGIHQRN